MGVVSQRFDLFHPEHVGPRFSSMSPAQMSSSRMSNCRRCRLGFTTPVTEKIAAFQVRRSGHGRARFVGLLGKTLTWDATRRFRLDVHAADWLHSMVLHRRCWLLSHGLHLLPKWLSVETLFYVSCKIHVDTRQGLHVHQDAP